MRAWPSFPSVPDGGGASGTGAAGTIDGAETEGAFEGAIGGAIETPGRGIYGLVPSGLGASAGAGGAVSASLSIVCSLSAASQFFLTAATLQSFRRPERALDKAGGILRVGRRDLPWQ
jgi:hypothetical protein